MEAPEDVDCLVRSQQHQVNIVSDRRRAPINPSDSVLESASRSLIQSLPERGISIQGTTNHLLESVVPALNGASLSPNYYSFVTGGITPAALIADNIVTLYDQNVQVHLPRQTLATTLEDISLKLLLDLFRLDPEVWPERTFTTGATSSNVLGLACGREATVNKAVRLIKSLSGDLETGACETVGEHGLLATCVAAGIAGIQILTTLAHSSLKKAASILGVGRSCVLDVGQRDQPLLFDIPKLKAMLRRSDVVSIVVISCGEVNTGHFSTHSPAEFQALRSICDDHGAWIHVDAAFGIFARAVGDSKEFEQIRRGAEGLELADSITGDAHKLLNVPYDCGFFFCRHKYLAQQVFRNVNAAYLDPAGSAETTIQSPLHLGIENSRRFRSLPVYATLLSYGRAGYEDMIHRQIRLARALGSYFLKHPDFDLLPESTDEDSRIIHDVFIIVLFRAKDRELNEILAEKVNASSRICVSGTIWNGVPACRIAAANWQAEPNRDAAIVRSVMDDILTQWAKTRS